MKFVTLSFLPWVSLYFFYKMVELIGLVGLEWLIVKEFAGYRVALMNLMPTGYDVMSAGLIIGILIDKKQDMKVI